MNARESVRLHLIGCKDLGHCFKREQALAVRTHVYSCCSASAVRATGCTLDVRFLDGLGSVILARRVTVFGYVRRGPALAGESVSDSRCKSSPLDTFGRTIGVGRHKCARW